MDYLQRDAYYTGVSYGHLIWKEYCVLCAHVKIWLSLRRGMHAIEDYIMSRYQMYLQIYFHPVSRSAEAILNLI